MWRGGGLMVRVLLLLSLLFFFAVPVFIDNARADEETMGEGTAENARASDKAESTKTRVDNAAPTKTKADKSMPYKAAPSLKPHEDAMASSAEDADLQEYYFLHVQGKGMPVKEIVLNGVSVLGGSVVSLSLPINVTRQIKQGLNELKVDFVSHGTEGLVTIMERRTPGPKKTEVARLSVAANESQGKPICKELAFNIDPAPYPPPKIQLTQDDEKEILALVDEYYQALKSKNAAKLRALYGPSLKKEEKIYPEGAKFFNKVLTKEIALMRREEIKMEDFSTSDVMLEQEDDKIKALRKDRKPMMQSNEIELNVEPILAEVTEESKGKGKKTKISKEPLAIKQRLVTTKLLFRKVDGKWCIALPQGV